MTNDLVATNNTPVVTPDKMLMLAVEQGADLDKLEKLMDLQDRWNATEASKAFSSALVTFQSLRDPIAKSKDGHNCKYADIDDIEKAIRPALKEAGLSYRFEQAQNDASITVTCIVTHVAGHSESTTITALADASGGKNAIQAMASTVTYLRRYSLTGALGITTGEDDNDGGKPAVTVEQLLAYNSTVRDEIASVCCIKESIASGDLSSAKEAWKELGEDIQTKLWRAPTKGGIFTTAEIAVIRSNEWFNA